MNRPVLTEDQRVSLGLIYEHFHRNGVWPRIRDLQRSLASQGNSIDVRAAIESLPPGSGAQSASDGAVSLTARGLFALIPDAPELRDLVRVVEFAVKRFRAIDAEPSLSRKDLRWLEMDAGSARRCFVLLRTEAFILAGGTETPDGDWTFDLSDEVWRFEGLKSVAGYFEREAQIRSDLGKVGGMGANHLPVTPIQKSSGPVAAKPTQDLFDALQELRDHRDAGQRMMAAPFKHGQENLWLNTASALIRRVFGDEDQHIINSYEQASAPRFVVDTEEDSIGNRNRTIAAKLPALDAAIEAGNKRLARLAGQSAREATISVPPTNLPSLTFDGIGDPRLRDMATRDYRELRFAVYQQLDKSQATLSGSVAEIALFDALLRKGVPAAAIEHETMGGLYKAAVREGILTGRSQKQVDAVKEVRNFVHAGVEYRSGALTHADANAALAIMFLVLEELGIH
jgi:hypothetical protein